jgi:hypothetical protein
VSICTSIVAVIAAIFVPYIGAISDSTPNRFVLLQLSSFLNFFFADVSIWFGSPTLLPFAPSCVSLLLKKPGTSEDYCLHSQDASMNGL